MNITVYCSSSNHVHQKYLAAADETGALIAGGGHTLVYGGGNVGLMGAVARSVHEHGGRVVGIIPEALKRREGIAYDLADEMIVTETMAERKGLMYSRADGFLVLPGGFGTLEEFLEVLTLRHLGYHDRPIALVNTDGFFDGLLAFFEHLTTERFASETARRLFVRADTPADALRLLQAARDGVG